MALSEQQIEKLIDYANDQVRTLVANYDVETFENDKDLQRMYLALSNMYDELNVVLSDVLPPAIYESYIIGVMNAEQLLEVAGLGAIALGSTGVQGLVKAPVHLEAISAIVSDTLDDLAAAVRTAKKYGVKELDKAFKEVQQELANGMIAGMTTKQMTKRVGEKFGNIGMTSFVTSDGKHLPLDFYAKTVTRTKMQTAYNHGHLNRYKERDVKYVEVAGNIPTCAECSVYRGIVFATERGDDFPYINLHKTFPVHPNCRCNFRPWIKKFKSDEDVENAKEKAKNFDPEKDARSKSEAKKYDANQKAKQQARKKRLTFNKMQARLGEDGPQSFNEFKNASKRQYHDWVAQMQGMYKKTKDTPFNDDDEQPSTNEQSNANEQVNDVVEEDVVAKVDKRVAKADSEVAEIMADVFNSEEVRELPQRDNFIKLMNSAQKDLYFTDSLGKNTKASHYDPSQQRIYLKPEVMEGIKDLDYNSITVFAHEYGHGTDDAIGYHIKKQGKRENGIEFNPNAETLNNLFEGLDLGEIVGQELKYKALEGYLDLKDFKEYHKNNFADFDSDIDKGFADKLEQMKKKKPSASEVAKVRKMNMDRRMRAMIEKNNQTVRQDWFNYRNHSAYSDMLSSLNVDAKSVVGHARSYWGDEEETRRMRGLEIFAEMGEIFSNIDTYENIKRNLPNTLDAYLQVIQEASHYNIGEE